MNKRKIVISLVSGTMAVAICFACIAVKNQEKNNQILEWTEEASIQKKTETCEVKMGYMDGNAAKECCSVKIPSDYIFTAGFEGTGMGEADLSPVQNIEWESAKSIETRQEYMEGGKALKEYSHPIDDIEIPVSRIILDSPDGGSMEICFIRLPLSYWGNSFLETSTIGSDDHPALYYKGNEDNVVYMEYQIDDKVSLTVRYHGPLVKKLGMENTAEELYSMVVSHHLD